MTTDQTISALTIPEQIWLWLRLHMMDIAGAFAVLVIGLLLAGIISRWVDRAMTRSSRFEPTVANFLSSLVKYALWALVLVTVLGQFGVQTTSILAALGGMALAVGLALQGTLSNVASGVMILVQKPFKVGEAINAGSVTGTVQQIGLFTTELKQFDGLFVMVPNSELWNQAIVNYNRHPTRRLELVVGIAYGDSMARAREELLKLALTDDRVLDDPEPVTFVSSLDDSSVGIGMRVWCSTPDYLGLSWDMTEAVKARFDDVGISIPFPQREIVQRAA
ncbi:MAG: mechanosensitive ion channel domain-containing protein [Pseudomonadota bacterium]|jgi:small conductance mechanosensitive channel|uniref:Small-conductance mechanosensitive channel n=1 Tax=Qipengyuania flava TaxID=192812 RepID=A0A222ERJ8_9SPHN|nr:mechanosensitive ion channel domain-containing protein [Qipengyuania flava]KZX52543.1 mechanosensitive ion channel protein [Erythrobacter sp. HI00D59]MAH15903.1 mechanosensitive ion channel protein [Sphingomonadaceae bacterium]MEC7421973.1 mechanosensitive ion channel domain-containing protein [Pseudomonadota bacterium]OAN85492.1 mechanosensitive ion channel protein [Erythrobacter sp. EhN03]ASP29215.1 mechanosensitive ion channel protein [Qipengyuania flava]|tara:strand:- start:456 stop:1289 length:834 start_codon:yes stop_codon:yes gene_type:complete